MQPDDGHYLELSTPNGETIKVLKHAHPRARRLRLTVTSSGARLSYPHGTHPAQVFAFLRKHADWLERKLDQLQLPSAGPPPLKPGAPTLIPLRGETTRLIWRDGVFPTISIDADRLLLTLPNSHTQRALPAARALLRSFLEAQIRRDVSRLLARYTSELNASPVAVRVRPLKSLWGSLDTRDCMTLDLALALAPPAALKYVVIHELCHLKIRNHSPRYWALVGSIHPEWKDQRDWLREKGHALKAELNRLIES
ncbi:MAG: SprT family zinc-dependent metalloprotease [Tahibacter sp.]